MASSTPKCKVQKSTSRRRRWLAATIVLLIPVAFALIAYVAVGFAGNMQLEEAFAEADALDPGWRLDELEGTRLPFPDPSRNGIDHVLRVKSALPPGQWPVWPFPQLAADDPYLQDVRFAMNTSLEGDRLAPTLLNVEQERVLRAELSRASAAVELARQMPNFPYGRTPIVWSKDFVSTLPVHVQKIREVAALLNLDARLRAHSNDLEGAFQNAKAILYASRAAGDEESYISQLVRNSVDSIAVGTLEQSLACGRVSEKTLLDLQKELEQEAQTPFFLLGFRGDRACLDAMFQNVQEGKITFGEYRRLLTYHFGFIPVERSRSDEMKLELSVLRSYLNLRAERAAMLHHMNAIAELAKQPTWEAAVAIEAKTSALHQNPPVWASLDPETGKLFLADLRIKATLRTAFTALAMERFQLAMGRWPDRLEELTPRYLASVPLDPYNGAPLHLARKGSAIVVYTVSPAKEGEYRSLSIEPDSNFGFVLQDPAQRRQPAKPFQFPERVKEPPPDDPDDGKL